MPHRSERNSSYCAALFALALSAFAIQQAQAQTQMPDQPEVSGTDLLRQRHQELETAREGQKLSAEAQKKLQAEIEALAEDRRKFNAALLDTATKIREAEERLSAGEARLGPLQDQESKLRNALDERHAVISEVLAILQRMGRRPPPALLVQPEDILQSLRSALMLGAVLPQMQRKVDELLSELSELIHVREQIAAEKLRLDKDLINLAGEQQRMAALIDQRQKQQTATEENLETERRNAETLARQAHNLEDLITRMEQGLNSAKEAAKAAQADRGKPGERSDLAAISDPGRLQPLASFASLRGKLPRPANGIKVRDFGGADGLGGSEKGISLVTRAGAQITSPCDGWVVYAGPFRSYGKLLILNAGGGYHIVLAGMDRISVNPGQFVLTGEPVAVMGSGGQVAAAVAVGSGQPMLYVEFRKDGTPVDPGPWWAPTESEKVRG